MPTSRALCMSIILSLAFTACAKKGAGPEPESSLSASEPSTVDYPATPSASTSPPTWETSPAGVETSPPQPNPSPSAEPVAAQPALTDEQIVGITETVDKGEIEQAKLAQKKAKNVRVKQFAAHMISQHTQSKQKGAKLAKQNKLTVSESSVGTSLESKANEELEKLKTADKADFDRAYTESQIAQHQEVLELLSSQLIPNASHPDLKAQLEEARSMVEKHLTEAKEIQVSLATP